MFFNRVITLVFILTLSGCGGGMGDDLDPSSSDQRQQVEAGSTGTQVSQVSPDFSITDSLSNPRTLSTELATVDAIVLYFTMWCPICDAHASDIRANIEPNFPTVRFFLVDYVSGTVSSSRATQLANGYGSSTVLVDIDDNVENLFNAYAGTTIVIDHSGVVRMNEDFKDGYKLRQVLEAL